MVDFNTEEEYREGYLVKAEMKKVWAVELDLLQRFIEHCRRHNLRCWVEGGTLLGAVRHKGFIPWDDDVDLAMPREDYDRLCQIGNEGLEPPYFMQTAYSDVDYFRAHAQFRRSDTAAIRPSDCFQPFNQGIFIDIFPLDAAPDDMDLVAAARKRSVKIFKFLKSKNTHCLSSGRLLLIFRKLRARYTVKKVGWTHIYRKAEDEMRALAKHSHTRVGEITTLGLKPLWNLDCFKETVWLPFENIMVPAPGDYDYFLRQEFGDNYMTPIQAPSAHGELIFSTDRCYTELLPKARRDFRISAVKRLYKKITKIINCK